MTIPLSSNAGFEGDDMSRKNDLTGNTYGKLKVISYAGSNKHKKATWLCKCLCGKEIIVIGSDLARGHTQSCGCARTETIRAFNAATKTKHGYATHPAYNVWKKMIGRCYNCKNKNYHQYGGRGITVYQEWLNNPKSFVIWAENSGYKKGLQIDRIDNDGNYEPSNCRWATPKTNNRNRGNNVHLTINGVTKTQIEWAEELGVHYTTLIRHRNNGTLECFVNQIQKTIKQTE